MRLATRFELIGQIGEDGLRVFGRRGEPDRDAREPGERHRDRIGRHSAIIRFSIP